MSPIELDNLLPEDVARVAMVGLAKNSGKTTTLNALLDATDRARRTVGLVSIGIDGEANDMLIGTRKPTIHAAKGDWIVTAQKAIARSGARVEYAESLGFSTPLGEVVVGQVLDAGNVILAGVRHQNDLGQALDALESHGVDSSFIDGAYGRLVAARPNLSDGVVVSTGAILGGDVNTIVEKTAYVLDRLHLLEADQPWQRDLFARARDKERALLGGPDIEAIELPARSALLGLSRAGALWSDDVAGIAIPGLVSDSVVESLLSVPGGQRVLLVPDGTVIQCDPGLFERLRCHWTIRVARRIRTLAVSINPTSVRGNSVDEAALRAAMRERWSDVEVFNPIT
jgi:hypothetical protein